MNILDASSLIALFKKEKGWEKIEQLFTAAPKNKESVFMHAINFMEFNYKCKKIFGSKKTGAIIADLETPFFGITNYFAMDLNLYAANLKANYHLSLADAIGLANTKIMKGIFWTADQALKPIAEKENISLKCIR